MIELIASLRERVLDAVDLALDALTLGEYGLQAAPDPGCERRDRSAVGVAGVDRGEHPPPHLDRTLQHIGI